MRYGGRCDEWMLRVKYFNDVMGRVYFEFSEVQLTKYGEKGGVQDAEI